MGQVEEVLETIRRSFELGRKGLVDEFNELHDQNYTRFSELPPYRLQERDEALRLKASLLRGLVDFTYQLIYPTIVVVDGAAVAVFLMKYRGMAVNSYAFEGRIVDATVRYSMVLQRSANSWKILHEHISKIPWGFSPD